MITVEIPKHNSIVHFSDNTPEEEIKSVLAKQFPSDKSVLGKSAEILSSIPERAYESIKGIYKPRAGEILSELPSRVGKVGLKVMGLHGEEKSIIPAPELLASHAQAPSLPETIKDKTTIQYEDVLPSHLPSAKPETISSHTEEPPGVLERIFRKPQEMTVVDRARASNILGLSEASGLPAKYIEENYDAITKNVGIRGVPTTGELITELMQWAIKIGLGMKPLKTIVGVASYMGVKEAESVATQAFKGEKPKLGAGRELKEFLGPLREPWASAAEVLEFALPASFAVKTTGMFKEWYYRLTVKEKAMVRLTYDDLASRGWKEADLAKMSTKYWQEAFEKRNKGEVIPEPTSDVFSKTPIVGSFGNVTSRIKDPKQRSKFVRDVKIESQKTGKGLDEIAAEKIKQTEPVVDIALPEEPLALLKEPRVDIEQETLGIKEAPKPPIAEPQTIKLYRGIKTVKEDYTREFQHYTVTKKEASLYGPPRKIDYSYSNPFYLIDPKVDIPKLGKSYNEWNAYRKEKGVPAAEDLLFKWAREKGHDIIFIKPVGSETFEWAVPIIKPPIEPGRAGGAPRPTVEELSALPEGVGWIEFESEKGIVRGKINDINPYDKTMWVFPADRSLLPDPKNRQVLQVPFDKITKVIPPKEPGQVPLAPEAEGEITHQKGGAIKFDAKKPPETPMDRGYFAVKDKQGNVFYDPSVNVHHQNVTEKAGLSLDQVADVGWIYQGEYITDVNKLYGKIITRVQKEPASLATLAEEQRKTDQAGRIIIDLGERKAKPSVVFESSETETLYQSAKGIKPEGIIERTKAIATEIGHKFARDFEYLANKKENAPLIFSLKRLEKQKDVVADRTTRNIGEILSGLDKEEYNIFDRKVILDDLYSDYQRGLYLDEKELPFKFTPESLKNELDRMAAIIATNPKVQEALAKRKDIWEIIKGEYIEALSPYKPGVEDMFKENYYRHQVLDYVINNGIFGTGKRLRAPTQRGYMKGRTGYGGLYNTDYLEAEHQIMAQMFYDIEIAKTLTKVKSIEDISGVVQSVPEGYVKWQPKEGNVFYPTLSINEKTAERLMTGEIEKFADVGDKLRKVLAVGGKRKEWIIREEVAETLDNLVRERARGLISSVDLGVMIAWKKWQLISPRRVFKYNFRNLTGDAEAVFLGNPSGFSKTPQALRELYEVFYQKKPMSPDMAAWFERGGISSTLQAQEMDTLKQGWEFTRLYEKKGSDLNLWKKYWVNIRLATDFRESILRYANFLDYKQQLLAGDGTPKNYGASKPEMISALESIDDKAFWLSNDLLGAYDRVSVAGQTIRERLIPFWSWQEVNFKRYIQLYKNAANDGDLALTIGKKLGAKTSSLAMRLGRLAIKIAAFATVLQVYNHTFFSEEEKLLPDDIKSTPHIIFGRDKQGDILYFNRMGTLDDFISWFGLDYAPRFVGDYLAGKRTLKELLQAQGRKAYEAPINKVTQGAAPFTKLAWEVATRRAAFPDIFKPGTIRDKYLHIARSFGLENEYVAVAGKPSKGYGKSVAGAFIYKIAPGEAAYRNVYDMKSDFLKKIGRTSEGFWLTPTGDALYNMKLAVKYNDKTAFTKYFTDYVSLASEQGKTKEQVINGLKTIVQSMHPLYGMNARTKTAFINSLNYDDQGTLARAIKFYNEILQGNAVP